MGVPASRHRAVSIVAASTKVMEGEFQDMGFNADAVGGNEGMGVRDGKGYAFVHIATGFSHCPHPLYLKQMQQCRRGHHQKQKQKALECKKLQKPKDETL
ncbi:Os02g0742600 [Oryza sativa Japonica Group]|uniref:Os02g0742600 protein n=1 Tax=Oryza sativa subsp. japonica TaxID=39947 RepID=A0A0P0VPW5_ORYSJ|nr:Os02g0742600 [Oryza sativa Japonica Group]